MDPNDIFEVWVPIGDLGFLSVDSASTLDVANFRLNNQWGGEGQIWHRTIDQNGAVSYTQVV